MTDTDRKRETQAVYADSGLGHWHGGNREGGQGTRSGFKYVDLMFYDLGYSLSW